ncbi:MAG: enoyl-CoA hydratase/isomerase family protein [Actinomycetes bacterium]
MVEIEQQGQVAVLRWRDGENRFHRDSVARWHEVLDELEGVDGALAVVVTGEGKFFSNGLDLDSFVADPDAMGFVVGEVHRLFGRLLLLPAYAVGALNGHTFAAGAMLACCLDRRVMREDRGFWCLPEADLGIPLTAPMFATVTARLPVAVAAEAMNTGRRYSGPDALAAGLVEHLAPEDELVDRAVALAEQVASKDRRVLAAHKRMLFGDVARACGVEV